MATRRVIAIVGSGLAGLSASIEAVDGGAKVVLFEKAAAPGGNSAKATSGINGVPTRAQRKLGVVDSPNKHYEDTMHAGRGLCDPSLVRVLSDESQAAIAFIEQYGVELLDVFQLGGHTAKRTHRERPLEGRPRPVGWDIVNALRGHLTSLPAEVFEIRTNTRVDALLQDHATSRVTGVEYEILAAETAPDNSSTARGTLVADAVILASGGYAFNPNAVLQTHAPQLAFLPTTNGPTSHGEGVILGMGVGAATRLLDQVQVHPTGFIDPKTPGSYTKFLAPEALRGSGGILLNRHGLRFVDELAPRDTVTGSIYRFSPLDAAAAADPHDAVSDRESVRFTMPVPSESFLVLTEEAVTNFGEPAFNFYAKVKKFFTVVSGPAGLAEYMTGVTGQEIPAAAVELTLQRYAQAACGKQVDLFGKTVFPASFADATQPSITLFVARTTPSIHYTMVSVNR